MGLNNNLQYFQMMECYAAVYQDSETSPYANMERFAKWYITWKKSDVHSMLIFGGRKEAIFTYSFIHVQNIRD